MPLHIGSLTADVTVLDGELPLTRHASSRGSRRPCCGCSPRGSATQQRGTRPPASRAAPSPRSPVRG